MYWIIFMKRLFFSTVIFANTIAFSSFFPITPALANPNARFCGYVAGAEYPAIYAYIIKVTDDQNADRLPCNSAVIEAQPAIKSSKDEQMRRFFGRWTYYGFESCDTLQRIFNPWNRPDRPNICGSMEFRRRYIVKFEFETGNVTFQKDGF